MRVRCERCSTVYELHDDDVDWAKDCPVCGQLAAWLKPTVKREPKQPSPFAVTAEVRPDAAQMPINCPPASVDPTAPRWETPPYAESVSPRPRAGHPWPTPPYMEKVPPAPPDEPPSPLPLQREARLPTVDLLDARFFLPIDASAPKVSEAAPRHEKPGDTERPHVHSTGGAPPLRSGRGSQRSAWTAFGTGAAIAAVLMGIYLGKHPVPRDVPEATAQLEAPPAPPSPPPVVEPPAQVADPPAAASAVVAVATPPTKSPASKKGTAACCGSSSPHAVIVPGRRGTVLRQAIVARCKGERSRARSLYESLLDASPTDPDALTGLGDVARDEDDWGGAREYYARALRRAPTFLPALLGAADVEWEVGNFAVAQQKYRDIADRMPSGSYPPRVTQRAADPRSGTPISG